MPFVFAFAIFRGFFLFRGALRRHFPGVRELAFGWELGGEAVGWLAFGCAVLVWLGGELVYEIIDVGCDFVKDVFFVCLGVFEGGAVSFAYVGDIPADRIIG